MPYDPPNSNEIYFVFSLSGYTPPDANEVNFNFTSLNTVSIDTSGTVNTKEDIDTAWSVNLEIESLSASGIIYDDGVYDTKGYILSENSVDTSGDLAGYIFLDADVEWKIININELETGWGIGTVFGHTAWGILDRQDENTTWSIYNSESLSSEGVILTEESVDTSWELATSSGDTGWGILTSFSKDTEGSILSGNYVDTSGKIINFDSIDVEGGISVNTLNLSWRISDIKSLSVGWGVLSSNYANTSGEISVGKNVDVGGGLAADSRNISGRILKTTTSDVSGKIIDTRKIFTKGEISNSEINDVSWALGVLASPTEGKILSLESISTEGSIFSINNINTSGDITDVNSVSTEGSILSGNYVDSSWKITAPDGIDISGKILTEDSVDTSGELATVSFSTSGEILFGGGFDTEGTIYNGDFLDISGKIFDYNNINTSGDITEISNINSSWIIKNSISVDTSGSISMIYSDINSLGRILTTNDTDISGKISDVERGSIGPFFVKSINHVDDKGGAGLCVGYTSPLSFVFNVDVANENTDDIEVAYVRVYEYDSPYENPIVERYVSGGEPGMSSLITFDVPINYLKDDKYYRIEVDAFSVNAAGVTLEVYDYNDKSIIGYYGSAPKVLDEGINICGFLSSTTLFNENFAGNFFTYPGDVFVSEDYIDQYNGSVYSESGYSFSNDELEVYVYQGEYGVGETPATVNLNLDNLNISTELYLYLIIKFSLFEPLNNCSGNISEKSSVLIKMIYQSSTLYIEFTGNNEYYYYKTHSSGTSNEPDDSGIFEIGSDLKIPLDLEHEIHNISNIDITISDNSSWGCHELHTKIDYIKIVERESTFGPEGG